MTRRSVPPHRHRRRRILVALLRARGVDVRVTAPAAPAAVTTQTPVMGPSLLERAATRGVVRAPPRVDRTRRSRCSATTSARSRRSSSTKARPKACAATWRSCSRCSRPAGWRSPARRSRPTRTTTRASTRSTGARRCRTARTATRRRAVAWGPPQHGVLRADATAAQLRRPVGEDAARPVRSPRRPTAPGMAPLWEYFGGHNCPCGKLIWASADDYGLIIIQMYSQALAESGLAGACVPYAPPVAGPDVGHRLLGRDARPRRAPARERGVLRRPRATSSSNAPLTGGESSPAGNGLLAARARRRHLHVRDGRVLRLDRRPAPQQAGERHGTHAATARATGSSPTTAASSRSATRGSTARWAATPEPAGARHGAHADGQGLLAVRERRRHLHASATPCSAARSVPRTSRRRSSRCSARARATATG